MLLVDPSDQLRLRQISRHFSVLFWLMMVQAWHSEISTNVIHCDIGSVRPSVTGGNSDATSSVQQTLHRVGDIRDRQAADVSDRVLEFLAGVQGRGSAGRKML